MIGTEPVDKVLVYFTVPGHPLHIIYCGIQKRVKPMI